jgi:hypothetical protein
MASLRSTVREFNVFRWAGRMLADAGRWRLRARIEARVRSHQSPTDRPATPGAPLTHPPCNTCSTRWRGWRWRRLRQRPLLAFDFDGTLAPIVARAEDARMSRPCRRA